MLLIIFMLCNAPFIDEDHKYILLRCGYEKWAKGQITYVYVSVFLFFALLYIFSFLTLLPNIYLSMGWGKIYITLSEGNYWLSMPMVYKGIINAYSPIQALIISFFLSWFCGSALVLVMLIVNILTKSQIGVFVSASIIMIDAAINYYVPYKFYHISPVSMSRLDLIDLNGLTTRPAIQYGFVFFIVVLSVLTVVSFLVIKIKKPSYGGNYE